MIASEVELCNHALSLLGESRISSLDEPNERSRLCALFYAQTRDELLADFEWPFAIARKALAAVDEENLTPWLYVYALPADLITLMDILDPKSYRRIIGVGYGLDGASADWGGSPLMMLSPTMSERFYLIEGPRLYTDFSPCYARYVSRETSVTSFPDLFSIALALAVASKVAPRLTQNMGLAAQMAQSAGTALTVAKSKSNIASRPRPTRNAQWSEYN